MPTRVEAYKRNKGQCSYCGQEHGRVHSAQEMVAEDVLPGERWYKCSQDGKIHTETIEWIGLVARITKAFGKQINRLTSIATNQEAGWFLGLNDEKVYRIDNAMLE